MNFVYNFSSSFLVLNILLNMGGIVYRRTFSKKKVYIK